MQVSGKKKRRTSLKGLVIRRERNISSKGFEIIQLDYASNTMT